MGLESLVPFSTTRLRFPAPTRCSQLQVQGIPPFLLASSGTRYTRGTHTFMQENACRYKYITMQKEVIKQSKAELKERFPGSLFPWNFVF